MAWLLLWGGGHRLLGKKATPGNCDGSYNSFVTKNQLLSQLGPLGEINTRSEMQQRGQLLVQMQPPARCYCDSKTAVEGDRMAQWVKRCCCISLATRVPP